jgi:hypothetical protein
LSRVIPRISVVVEGVAAHVADEPRRLVGWWDHLLDMCAAPRDGDSEIFRQAVEARTAGLQPLVVTADRRLRERVHKRATSVGPNWLLELLDGVR